MPPVQLFCWHFMAYPYLPADFDEKYDSGWVTVPNALWDRERTRGLYQEYIDQLVYGEELGFDGLVLNEHHQNIYGLMPSPNIIAAALTQRTNRAKIAIVGNLLPLRLNPLQVAEEYAMLDSMSDGRMICGFAVGGGQEAFNYDIPAPQSRTEFWEAVDLIRRAWTEPGPFRHEGRHYPMRYVNPWPLPQQRPHPPIWIPGALSIETMGEAAKRGATFFLSSRSHGPATVAAANKYAEAIESTGERYHPQRFGILISAFVGETDEQAQIDCDEGVWYFLKNCLKGHLRQEGRVLTFGAGMPTQSVKSWEQFLLHTEPGAKMLGDAANWDELAKWGSIFLGSPKTVRERLWALIEGARPGYLLMQFHFGNMRPEVVKKSMHLFATEVAPYLRERSAELYAKEYPHAEGLAIA
jgi:alkanesulfonate monooxygenase SsuD/methylene tetrahydromethanopterin reductase-like flavin-dependent oxidoreductase (luciferase family)